MATSRSKRHPSPGTANGREKRPPPRPEVLRAVALQNAGQIAEAEQLFVAVLRADQHDFHALHQLGLICYGRDQHAEAVLLFATAAEQRPDSPEALSNLGLALHGLKRFEEAVAAYDAALVADPRHGKAHYNRGNALTELGRHEEALQSLERALALQPGDPDVLYVRGNALRELRRHDDAMAAYDRALALDPGRVDVHFNQALTLLRLGRLREGFAAYEWRCEKPEFSAVKVRFPSPPWRGEEPVAGKTLLLHPEQGLGDVVQFLRYVPVLAEKGARVIVAVPPPLLPLVEGALPGAAEIYGWGTKPPPGFDLHTTYPSLPHAMGTTLETIPAHVPYLTVPEPQRAAEAARLGGLPKPRIGLVWAGNPEHGNDHNRSVPLATLAPLLDTPGVSFVSLQKVLRPGDEAFLQARPGILRRGEAFSDFAETAAAIALLDLVISVDTSVAHLAGALGKPSWILLPWSPDWRWLLDRDDTPWYPTARLFRQPKLGDWDGVVARLRDEVANLAAGRPLA